MEKKDVRKLAHGTSMTFAGGILGAGFTYLTGIYISRLVGSELVGVYYLSLIWIQLLSAISRFGFADALLRFLPPEWQQGRHDNCLRIIRTILGLGVMFGLVVGIGMFLLIPVLGDYFEWEPVLVSYLRWFFLSLPLHVLFALMMMVVQSYQRITQVVLVRDLLQPASLFLFTAVFLKFIDNEQFGLIAGFAISLVLSIALIYRWVRVVTPGIGKASGWMALGPLFAFAIPAMVADASHFLYRWIDTLLVSYFFNMRDVGIYSAAIRTSMLLVLIPVAINAIYATMASGYYHTGAPEKLERVLQLSTRWCLILGLPIVVLFVLSSREILSLWGAEFAAAHTTMSILVLAQLFNIPAGILAYTLVMCNRPTLELFNTLTLLVLVVAANLVLIPVLGLVGAAVSLMLVNAIGMVLRWRQVHGYILVRPFNRSVLKPFVSIVPAAVAGYLVSLWLRNTFGVEPYSIPYVLLFGAILMLIVCVVYLAAMYMLGFENEDRIFIDMIRTGGRQAGGGDNAV